MSDAKGPYIVCGDNKLESDDPKWRVAGPGGELILGCDGLGDTAMFANKVHHHALAAQAERVAGLEAALKVAREFIDEASCLNDDDVAGFVDDGYFAVLRKIDALTPPAKGGAA